MTFNSSTETDHDVYASKLPWYLNGTLDASEIDPLREHIATCADCQNELALLSSVNKAIKSAPLQGINTNASLKKMQERIAENSESQRNAFYAPIVSAMRSLLSHNSMPSMALAGFAGVVLAFLVLVQQPEWLSGGSDDSYHVLSSGDTENQLHLNVAFVDSVNEQQSEATLEQVTAQFSLNSSWIKSDKQVYTLTIKAPSENSRVSPAVLSDLIQELNAMQGVHNASIAP